ncbi:MAG: flagellar basal body P-ring formation chaperone FlgA [Verrucomicrobia bacterium]|nr:flagellar basal body P-ring formation chaperone FlgA [Verrucomicrobiota bacterium]
MKNKIIIACLLFLIQTLLCGAAPMDADTVFRLSANTEVSSEGVFLDQLVTAENGDAVPHLKIADAPDFGKMHVMTRSKINEILNDLNKSLVISQWSGAERACVSRKTRMLEQQELRDVLTAILQEKYVKTLGALELRFARPWTPVRIPDEEYQVKLLDMPASGISAYFMVRFEIVVAGEAVGDWNQILQAKVWRDVYVTANQVRRSEWLSRVELASEKRDILDLRDVIVELPDQPEMYEFSMSVRAGSPLTPRMLKLRPLIKRGEMVEAVVDNGTLQISLKVQALEDGAIGQAVRVRNLRSQKELYGEVKDENTVLVSL